ncbi:MAG: hypothetical protein VB084_13440 [Syntrophomonadaceae bacterium]|nr:hypothetical protein [Syntrophomonadaceae bacterium]
MADEIKTCWFCGEEITDEKFNVTKDDGQEFFIHKSCVKELEKKEKQALSNQPESSHSGILNTVAWATLVLSLIGALIVWITMEGETLGIVLGIVIFLYGLVAWAFLLTICDIADDLKIIKLSITKK